VPILIKTTGFEQYMNTGRSGSYIKALIMGEHGVGKTPSAASWPKPIIADCENGLASVASRAIPYAEIRTTDDMLGALDACRRDAMLPPEKRQFLTFVVDTIDSYQRRIIQQRLKAEQKDSMSGWQDWGWLDGKMAQLVEGLLSLPMNVVVNMHVKDVDDGDEDSRMLVKKARLKGDFKDSVFQDFDLIGLMEASYVQGTGEQKGERVQVRNIRWHSEPRFPSLRDRFNKLPRFTTVDFTDQDYWRIFNAITVDMDSIPETKVLDEVASPADTEAAPAPADVKGGPVEEPKLPREPAKKATKKAPARKATAKKVATVEPVDQEPAVTITESDTVAEPGEPIADAWTPDPMAVDDDDQAAEAVALVTEKLGATDVQAEDFIAEPATEPTPAPVKAPAAQPKSCGDQPASMTRYDPAPGCGRVLSQQIAGRHQLAVLKAKTYLCDDCFDKYLANAQ
jgi:hypothetical protein